LRSLIVALSIAVAMFSSVAYAKPKSIAKNRIEIQTEYGPIVLQNIVLQQTSFNEFVLTGTATNNSTRAWRILQFILTLRDKSGKELTDDLGGLNRQLSINNLGKAETKPLGNFTGSESLKLFGVRKVEDFDVQLDAKQSYYDSHPIFVLTQPVPSKTLTYEDDAISIAFIITNEQLEFTLSNKTQEPQSINWDEVSYVDLSGTAHRVLHKGVKLVDRDKPQSPTVIPPGARIDDLIEPSDSVQWSSVINDWEHDPLLPPSQRIVDFKGKTFGAFLPIEIDGKKKNYTFTIRIDDVQM